jgi:AcrR family transcriptional regulator
MGIAERKERERELRRSAIIDAAEQVFFTKGIETSTMDEVAELAELSKGTLYLYFKSKAELYMAICGRGLSILHEKFNTDIEGSSNGLDQLRLMGQSYFDFARDYPDHFKATLHYEMNDFEGDIQGSDICSFCQTLGDGLFNLTIVAIQKGIADGSIRTQHPPKELAVMLWSSMRGIIQLFTMRHRGHNVPILKEINFDDLVPHYIDMVINGLSHSIDEVPLTK